MKVLISGSRNMQDYAALETELNKLNPSCIVHGCAKGADSLAQQYANKYTIPVKRYPANWDKHGKAAGPIRNQEMLKEKPDVVLAFLAKDSKGTAHMIKISNAAKIKVIIIDI